MASPPPRGGRRSSSAAGLKSRKLHGQAGSVDDEAIADALRKVRETIAKYDPECIVNCDETALQYKLLPRFTYTAADEDKSSVCLLYTSPSPRDS